MDKSPSFTFSDDIPPRTTTIHEISAFSKRGYTLYILLLDNDAIHIKNSHYHKVCAVR